MLFYLPQSVAVPPADEQAGKVTITRNADGSPFDWGEVTRDLFQIKTSATRPQAAAVAARSRGHWFYIDDTDLDCEYSTGFSRWLRVTADSRIDRPAGRVTPSPSGGGPGKGDPITSRPS